MDGWIDAVVSALYLIERVYLDISPKLKPRVVSEHQSLPAKVIIIMSTQARIDSKGGGRL